MDNTQVLPCIANRKPPAYSLSVAANSAIGFGDPSKSRRTSATVPKAGAFFMPANSFYGGCARDTLGYAGFLDPRFANLRTAATQYRLATISGGSSIQGAVPMKHTPAINPSASHAAAWKARAMAALRADSSLSVRLARYNAAMARARQLETVGGAA
jgi:hypothetical protein